MLNINGEIKTGILAKPLIPENKIYFHCGDKEIIRLEPNGDIYVRGELVENDKDVVEGMRDFLRGHEYAI